MCMFIIDLIKHGIRAVAGMGNEALSKVRNDSTTSRGFTANCHRACCSFRSGSEKSDWFKNSPYVGPVWCFWHITVPIVTNNLHIRLPNRSPNPKPHDIACRVSKRVEKRIEMRTVSTIADMIATFPFVYKYRSCRNKSPIRQPSA